MPNRWPQVRRRRSHHLDRAVAARPDGTHPPRVPGRPARRLLAGIEIVYETHSISPARAVTNKCREGWEHRLDQVVRPPRLRRAGERLDRLVRRADAGVEHQRPLQVEVGVVLPGGPCRRAPARMHG